MKRRKAVTTLLAGIGGAILAPGVLLSGCTPGAARKEYLTDEDILLLDEVGETIIPATASSPGAKAAKIGQFMKVQVTDCYSKKDQETFIDGIGKLQGLSKEMFDKQFLELDYKQKNQLIVSLNKKADDYTKTKKKDEQDHYFLMMKNLAILGYFTSEAGASKARRYIQNPGYYNGNIPYKKGDKAWAV